MLDLGSGAGRICFIAVEPLAPIAPEATQPFDCARDCGHALLRGRLARMIADLSDQPVNAPRFAQRLAQHDLILRRTRRRVLQINVSWQGEICGCDFNQMTGLPLAGRAPQFLWNLDPTTLEGETITTAEPCLGCTAGVGSSCGGAIA